ncbi:MAG: protoheme IX farnesyltransferase [Chthonomonas sp.]|nr:protoheme IX farnesyltransferase [Chthonomonas sp.]
MVIAWGAFVRASKSGDGCGAHWPLCNGEFHPGGMPIASWIEYAHRISSGLVMPMVLWLWVLANRATEPGHILRRTARKVAIFTLIEALLGAVLVKFSLVGENSSLTRAAVMGVHLCNTLILLGFMVAFWWLARGGESVRIRGAGKLSTIFQFSMVGLILTSVSGAIAALGDTLFPAKTLAQGLRQDFSADSPTLLILRTWHPVVSVSVAVMIVVYMSGLLRSNISPAGKKYAKWVLGIVYAQLAIGVINVLLLAPVWMQIVHLVVADSIWIALLLAAFTTCARPEAVGLEQPLTETLSEPAVAGATWRDYLALTKPRVISLLLLTTLLSAFIAAGGWPGGWLLLALTFGGYAAAGAANTFNMVYDRDIDIRMERTAKRPTVTTKISARNAMIFGFALTVFSFVLLTLVANVLAASMAIAGLLFYVFIYTMGLKRRTPQNIVIGGAAGSFPPLVGYAAVANQLPALAWVLFALIFLWTPVHFWALALMIKDEYKDAGVPMLPVVKGERATVIQIGFYTILTAACSLIPIVQGEARTVYLVSAVVLNIFLIQFTAKLIQRPERPQAFKVFKYSMVYLALMFLMIAVDRARWM